MTQIATTHVRRRAKLRGKTTRHPTVIEILQVGQRACKVRVVGGQHDGKKERFVLREILERFYEPA